MGFGLSEDSSSRGSEKDDVWSDDDAGYETDFTDPTDVAESAWLLEDDDHPPEYYLRLAEDFDETEDAKEDYSAGTTLLLDRIEEQWCQYCRYISKDPQEMYRTIYAGRLYSFSDWLLSQKRGKGGRRRRGTKHKSSLGTYWKLYRLVYERATGEKLNGQINPVMHRVLRKLVKKHHLKDEGREKPCMYVEDLKEVLRTNIHTSNKKRCSHGRLRMEIQLFMQLAGFTATEPVFSQPGIPNRLKAALSVNDSFACTSINDLMAD